MVSLMRKVDTTLSSLKIKVKKKKKKKEKCRGTDQYFYISDT